MKCIFCGYEESKVIDSRSTEDGETIRRRRECLKCAKRFTTYEKVESLPLVVIKKDNSRQPFDRSKLLSGLIRACEKRPVSIKQLEDIVDGLESALFSMDNREIQTRKIGDMVLSKLRDIDAVAYVRFASVYKEFKDINSFMEELQKFITQN